MQKCLTKKSKYKDKTLSRRYNCKKDGILKNEFKRIQTLCTHKVLQ